MKFDDIVTQYLGEFGRYQKIQFILVVIPTIFCAFHSLSWTFTAPNIAHRCRLESEATLLRPRYQIGPNLLLNGCENQTETGQCSYKSCSFSDGTACKFGYAYADTLRYTAVERWDLVCDKHVLKPIVQTSYYIGQLFGSLIFGFLGDRYGRKKIFLSAIAIQFISGIGMSLANGWYLFAFFRMWAGFAHPGIFMTSVILGMELIGSSYRSLASIFAGALFSIGQAILGTVAYFVTDYRMLIPESARWLVSQRRYEEADKILRMVARRNGRNMPEKWWDELEIDVDMASPSRKRKKNFLDLLKTPKARVRTLVMFFCWPVVSMAYYGMSMKPDLLGTDPYVNFIAEIPATIFMFFTVDKLGRRPLLCGGLILAGLTLFSNVFVSENTWEAIPMIQFLLSKASLTLCYAVIYAYTPELFPTEIRNMAVGGCSMMARFGASALLVALTLPETANHAMLETVKELEGNRSNDEKMIPLTPQGKSLIDQE
uniref:Major facilitator superfamily (MFS) profile domain-containing protein n=1 Tax=Panagrolaimus sp. ES5 TaxID=591445 RepID=A0AC34FYG8_9BILA